MLRSFARRGAILLAASTMPVLLIGNVATASAPTAAKLKSATLNGSGSSLQYGYDQVVIGDFKKAQKSVTINYASKGSGAGRQEFAAQVTDFAGSDAPFSASEQPTVKGGPYLYFPTVADPIVIAYNLSGVKDLQLSGDTIAKIFQGEVTTWDDPAIKADNPKAKLPSTKITPAVRSDSSGTTQNFTTYLTKAAPGAYTLGASSKPNWPASDQQGAQNTGVAQIVQSTDGAVGYVDYSDAQAIGLVYAKVKNADGKFLAPSTAGAVAALEKATVNPDLTYDPIFPAGGKAYPITSPTYIIAYQNQTDAAKGNALKAFLDHIYTDGQKTAPTVDYAPLSKDLLQQAKAQVDKIVVPAS